MPLHPMRVLAATIALRMVSSAPECPAGSIPGSHGVPACCPTACGHCGGRGCEERDGGRQASQLSADGCITTDPTATSCHSDTSRWLASAPRYASNSVRSHEQPPSHVTFASPIRGGPSLANLVRPWSEDLVCEE